MTPEQQEQWSALVADFQEKARILGKQIPLNILATLTNEANGNPVPSSEDVRMDDNDDDLQQNPSRGLNFVGHEDWQSTSSTTRSNRTSFEKVTHDIPIEKFPFGVPGADWTEWSMRFELAVQAATNAQGRDRLEALCLLWISLKLNDEAMPLYNQCPSKKTEWVSLKAELEEAFEDTHVKRLWVRSLEAFKKPEDMSLQVYKAKVMGMVSKYSPATLNDAEAHEAELYSRFVGGLGKKLREYIEESVSFGEETLDEAFHLALKYEEKLKKSADFAGAAMRTKLQGKEKAKKSKRKSHSSGKSPQE